MADIQLQHEVVTAAVEEMQQAAKQMHENLQELIQGLTPLKASFQGDSATAFDEFFNVVSQNDGTMTSEFAQGGQILNDMHEGLRRADAVSAQGFQR